MKIWLYYWPKIVPSVVSFIILIFLIISYFWFYIWRLNIKHCHQKSLVWWKKCEIPINYLIFLHFLGEKIAFTSNATYILLYLTSRSTVLCKNLVKSIYSVFNFFVNRFHEIFFNLLHPRTLSKADGAPPLWTWPKTVIL